MTIFILFDQMVKSKKENVFIASLEDIKNELFFKGGQ